MFRTGVSIQFSRILEIDPKTKEIVWKYLDKSNVSAFYSPFMGSAQRLANGNTFISESEFGRIFEVPNDGEVVWEYLSPYFGEYEDPKTRRLHPGETNSVYRAYRYSLEEVPWLNEKLGL